MLKIALLAAVLVAFAAVLRRWGTPPFSSREVLAARERWQSGRVVEAEELAAAALPGVATEVIAHPHDAQRRMAHAEALAIAGERDRAMREAIRAVAVHPAPWARHPRARESLLASYAVIATEAGAFDEAVRALDRLLERSDEVTRDGLRADVRFARLRSDARFAALIHASGEPQGVPTPTPGAGAGRGS